MDHDTQRITLLKALLDDNPQYRHLEIPTDFRMPIYKKNKEGALMLLIHSHQQIKTNACIFGKGI